MSKPVHARLEVTWEDGKKTESIPVQFNPSEFSLDKGAQIVDIPIPGLDAPLVQFIRGQSAKLTVDLFFDTTEDGMGAGATSVTKYTDQIYQLVKIEPGRHAPPICKFRWGPKFPGDDISSPLGNQKKGEFQCVVETVKQKFTLFSPEGIPLRATLTVSLREYKPLDQQVNELKLHSPNRTQSHIVQRGETLASIAANHYLKSGEWRRIADENAIEDPRRLTAGTFLTIPPIT